MDVYFTDTQKKRLIELNASDESKTIRFDSNAQREKEFKKIEAELLKRAKERLDKFKHEMKQPELIRLRNDLEKALIGMDFVQVTTPTILSKKLLEKMTITSEHALNKQVFWLSDNKCLRPMLGSQSLLYLQRSNKVMGKTGTDIRDWILLS